MLNPQRTIDELKELRELTGDENGAQRVAFTEKWEQARSFMCHKFKSLPVRVETDEAGNQWATLKGKSDREVLIGGHIDSVPNGGWLDGSLNVLAGLEVLRRIASEGTPPVTVRLVDWADEEGARFGRSLFGSSACSGTMNPDELRHLKDRDGISLIDALARVDIDFERIKESHRQLANAKAYLELHIEQGPVLLNMDLPLGVVIGTFGVERWSCKVTGQAAHSGSTPMNVRKDALLPVSHLNIAQYDIARRHGGVSTMGSVITKPGIVTSVVGEAVFTLDQRHMEADKLAAMFADAQAVVAQASADANVTAEWNKIWDIMPIPFDPTLQDFAEEAVLEVAGVSHRLPSGPLHDAPEMQRAGIPTVMLFVQSLHGISHNKIEDTKEEHLAMSVRALDRLASKTMAWVAAQ